MNPTSLTLRLYIFGIYSVFTCGADCLPSEYLSPGGDCCPMCNIGMVVYNDCSDLYSTSCKSCSKGTYMNEPNGHRSCFQCKTCGRGLSILKNCTTIHDTICEASDGYYCLHYKDRECIHAVEHSKCIPGQHIKNPGTKASDTVCESCPSGSYSPEGVNCTKWTDCSDNNEVEAQESTSITDVECKPKAKKSHLVVVLAVGILLPVFLTILCLVHRPANEDRKELKRPVEETSPNDQPDASQSSILEVKDETDSSDET